MATERFKSVPTGMGSRGELLGWWVGGKGLLFHWVGREFEVACGWSALEGMVGLEVHRDNVYTLLMNHRCVCLLGSVT